MSIKCLQLWAMFKYFYFMINLWLFVISALNPEPKFGEPIPNVTVAVGRDASLPCVVENLGSHKVQLKITSSFQFVK